ncbi:MAG: prolyl oligopeptidase family serine peptidase [Verrucomicrobia bacterium]|nr:prolyl oligopeptidase family serine peptidase [Verrucomicrobiota bacterium]
MNKLNRRAILVLCAAVLALTLNARARAAADAGESSLQRVEFKVEGVARETLVYAPAAAKTTKTPLVFVFHGHGGNSRQASRSLCIHRVWPEVIVVYPQGLNTPGRLTDPEGKKPGWQARLGDQQDRDLKFFDAMLARLKQDYKVDEKRIYCTGHSNGGAFTYMLWAARGEVFAAVAPSAAAAVPQLQIRLKPKPAFHLAGEKDPLVKFEWQQMTMGAVRKLNGCAADGKEWAKNCTLYPSKTGTPFVAFIHSGGHGFPAEAPALMVKFFKEHPAAAK